MTDEDRMDTDKDSHPTAYADADTPSLEMAPPSLPTLSKRERDKDMDRHKVTMTDGDR